MFDKFITEYIEKGTSVDKQIKDQINQPNEVAAGLAGQQKKYGVKFKLGGIVSRGQKLARSKLTKLF